MSARILAATLASACALIAQGTAVFPSDHASISNGASYSSWFPYSYGVSRIQVIYESWDLTVPAGHAINRIGFRQDGTTLSYGHSLNLQVLMAPTEKTAADASSTYATNYFAPPTSVFGPALFTMPDMGNVLNPNPDGNMIWLTLTTPYTPVVGKNLLVEFVVLANNNGGASFSYYLDVANFDSPRVTGPAGCPHSGNQVPQLHSRATQVGSTWYCDLTQAPAGQLAIWFIHFGTLVPQFPLTPLLAGISPACQGQLPLVALLSVSATTSAGGSHTFSVPVPNDRIWNDVTISSQAVCFDFFSPGGVVVSNGDQMQIGIDPAMTLIYSQSAAAASGSVFRNYGLVTFFNYL